MIIKIIFLIYTWNGLAPIEYLAQNWQQEQDGKLRRNENKLVCFVSWRCRSEFLNAFTLKGEVSRDKKTFGDICAATICLFTNYFSGRELLRGGHRREKEKVAVHFWFKSEGVFWKMSPSIFSRSNWVQSSSWSVENASEWFHSSQGWKYLSKSQNF